MISLSIQQTPMVLGTLRILEAVRLLGLTHKTRIYQASTSELFGLAHEVPQSEKTPFYPRSPYGVAKLYAYWITVNYREAYGLHASNGILFNHESPIRGETFVTRKITRAVSRIVLGLQDLLFIGNLSSKRDWGHAKDFVKAMYLILQQNEPDDYVIATGITTEVREFIRKTFNTLGIEVRFSGKNEKEIGTIIKLNDDLFVEKTGREYLKEFKKRLSVNPVVIKVDVNYFRPTEVDILVGDASKARKKLGWIPKHDLDCLINDMLTSDLNLMKKESHIRKGGYKTFNYFE